MQVLQLAPEQISALDPGQRDSVMQLVSEERGWSWTATALQEESGAACGRLGMEDMLMLRSGDSSSVRRRKSRVRGMTRGKGRRDRTGTGCAGAEDGERRFDVGRGWRRRWVEAMHGALCSTGLRV
jgi:hypothetical protein